MTSSLHARVVCLLALGAILCGCSFTQPPQVRVVDAALAPGNPGESNRLVLIEVEVENANAKPLPLRTVEYAVAAPGAPVFRSEREALRTAPRFGSQRFVLPATLPAASVDDGQTIAIAGVVEYERPGAFSRTLRDLTIIRPDVSFVGRVTPTP
jgi:hypothetical protein